MMSIGQRKYEELRNAIRYGYVDIGDVRTLGSLVFVDTWPDEMAYRILCKDEAGARLIREALRKEFCSC